MLKNRSSTPQKGEKTGFCPQFQPTFPQKRGFGETKRPQNFLYNLLDEGEKKKVLTDKKRLIHALQTPGMTKRAGFRPYCCRKGERPMKGVNKRVIEINRPESEYIEKVLIFLRQKDGHVHIAQARQEAEGYLDNLVSWHRFPLRLPERRYLVIGGICLAAAAGLALFVLL